MAHESTMLALGTAAPEFSLPDAVSGNTVSSRNFAGKPMLVMFLCTHCPFVVHVENELATIANEYGEKVVFVGICANDTSTHPADGPEGLKAQAERVGFSFPYLFDESQDVAKAYTAACTPDFFLFDAGHRLVYRGRMDASRPRSDVTVTGEDLRAALDAVTAGETPSEEQYPSMGCNVKWKAGNEPGYFG